MICHDLVCYYADQCLPIWWWYWRIVRDFLAVQVLVIIISSSTFSSVEWGKSYFCACTASNINNALLKFLPLSFAILSFSLSASGHPSFFPLRLSTSQISTSDGAATLTSNVRLLIGAIIFAVLFASNISLKLGLYFSIVLLKAACASLVK